jgi:hypothetical protein
MLGRHADNGDRLDLNEKNTWKDWFNNYKRLNLYSNDVTIDEMLK